MLNASRIDKVVWTTAVAICSAFAVLGAIALALTVDDYFQPVANSDQPRTTGVSVASMLVIELAAVFGAVCCWRRLHRRDRPAPMTTTYRGPIGKSFVAWYFALFAGVFALSAAALLGFGLVTAMGIGMAASVLTTVVIYRRLGQTQLGHHEHPATPTTGTALALLGESTADRRRADSGS